MVAQLSECDLNFSPSRFGNCGCFFKRLFKQFSQDFSEEEDQKPGEL